VATVGHDDGYAPGPGAVCGNCAAPLRGRFCSRCGQPHVPPDPTWHELVHDSLHEFLHLDGKIFATVRRLFFEPGELTVEHIRGRRVRYVGALRLYLTMSVVFFALSAVVPNPNPDADPAHETATAPAAAETPVATNAGTGIRSRMATGIRRAREDEEQFDETLAHTFQRTLFVLVPVFALLLKLAYRNRQRHYPQFLYFGLHFHAAVFGFLALTVPLQALTYEGPQKTAQALVLAGSFVYLVAALKRVFGGTTFHTVVRASTVSAAYLTLLIATTAAVVLLTFYRLGSQP
jgi:hypothetical protein